MDPNTQPTPSPTPAPAAPTPEAAAAGPPAAGQGLVEYIRTQRQNAAYALLGLSILFLVATIWLGVRGFRPGTITVDKPAATNPLDPLSPPEAPKTEIADPKKRDYLVGGIGTLIGFLATAGVGMWLMLGQPAPGVVSGPEWHRVVERQRTEARIAVLVVGGILGAALIVLGGAYFYRWSDSLAGWLDKGEAKEMRWVVIPLLMVVGGAALVFAAVQPARAEERNNPGLRRLVYGSNFGLTVLLLLVALVVVNVVIALKVPNQLDTTETGFYSLSEATKGFLSRLPEPVTARAVIPDSGDRQVNDIRQLLRSCEEASEGRFRARFVSPVSDKAELANLQTKYPRMDRSALGILLTVGEDEKRHAFIPLQDLFKTEFGAGGRQQEAFAGEAQIMRELRHLSEGEQKPVVYFTQSNGEFSLNPGGAEIAGGGSVSQLKGFLEKNYIDVRPLTFPPQNPSVPDDASVVVVVEPQAPFSEAAAGALRKYMTTPRPDGRKGKMIVLAGPVPSPAGKGIAPTGLEGLLGEFGVRLGDKYVYSVPINQAPNPRVAIALFARASEQNPINQTIGSQIQALTFTLPREVSAGQAPPAGGAQASNLLITLPGRPTWLEDERLADPMAALQDMIDRPAVRAQRGLTEGARPVAVVVSEGGGGFHGAPAATGRMLVVGSGDIVSDRYAERVRGGVPATFDLVSVAIDWLRDRPPLPSTIDSKLYKEYTFPEPATIDTTRLIWFPLGLGLLTVIGLGAGVWVIRRK